MISCGERGSNCRYGNQMTTDDCHGESRRRLSSEQKIPNEIKLRSECSKWKWKEIENFEYIDC